MWNTLVKTWKIKIIQVKQAKTGRANKSSFYLIIGKSESPKKYFC